MNKRLAKHLVSVTFLCQNEPGLPFVQRCGMLPLALLPVCKEVKIEVDRETADLEGRTLTSLCV